VVVVVVGVRRAGMVAVVLAALTMGATVRAGAPDHRRVPGRS
jgi:hypothetical protein